MVESAISIHRFVIDIARHRFHRLSLSSFFVFLQPRPRRRFLSPQVFAAACAAAAAELLMPLFTGWPLIRHLSRQPAGQIAIFFDFFAAR